MLLANAQTRLDGFELDVRIEVESGRCVAVAGPSGAGKTTLLRIVAGLLRPDRAVIRLGDRIWADTHSDVWLPPERRRCGYVFQDYALFGHLRAWQNVAYPLRRARRGERERRARELLERLGAAEIHDRRPAELSGGERQRVALARALASEPDVLLLDEPLSALDPRTRAGAGRQLGEAIRASGRPTLLVTHDFGDAALLGDEVAVIDGGRVIQRGSASDLAARPASAFVADFTGAFVLTGTARRRTDSLTHIALDGGGELAATAGPEGPVAISVYPWEVTLEPCGLPPHGSAMNRLPASVVSMTTIGNRVRVGLDAGQPLVAEITEESARRLAIVPGARVVAAWKAAATRVLPGS